MRLYSPSIGFGLADSPANSNFYTMKTSMDRAGRLVIPQEIRRKSGIKPGMPLEVRWEKGAIAITLAPSSVRLERKGRLLVAIRLKNGPSLSTKTVNSTRKAQRKGFRHLIDRVHKEGEEKEFTKLEDLPD
jgi:AbrB family looped-hinge helix DNA binding protein